MKPERFRQIRELFDAAQAYPPESRDAFVQNACGGDGELLVEVRRLLAVHDEPTVDSGALNLAAFHERSGLRDNKTFGSYRLIHQLGQGGFGEVWEAESLHSGRRLALKILTASWNRSPEMVERFKREGRLAASVNHPHCVFIFAAEEMEGYPTIAMELMRGGTLQDRINKDGPLPAREAVDSILDVIEGLEAANRVGILHRDIKPSNCFVDENGRCKIGDFGISKILAVSDTLTETGTFIGTPSFASPEQVRGREISLQSDIYSVGATLYALVTGRPPFFGNNVGELLARIVSESPRPFPARASVPPGVQRIIVRAMSKQKEIRFATYVALRAALLPFSSRGLTSADMVKRFAAIEVDFFLISIITLAVLSVAFRTTLFPFRVSVLATSLLGSHSKTMEFAIFFLYFFLQEAIWGRSIGKRLSELRIETSSVSPVTYGQVFLRTLVFAAISVGPKYVFKDGLGTFLSLIASPIDTRGTFDRFLSAALAPGVCLLTARASNGYAGIQ
jgi:serine/threonine protein kinase